MRFLFNPLCVAGLAIYVSGCASLVPAGSLDYGRGAAAMEKGTIRVQATLGSGVALGAAGAGAGLRVETQVSETLSVEADVAGGIELVPSVSVGSGLVAIPSLNYQPQYPIGGYVGSQWNPGNFDFLALRLRLGAGSSNVTNLRPDNVAGNLEVVLSVPKEKLEAVELWGGAKLGGRYYLMNGPVVDMGIFGGIRLPLGDQFSLFAVAQAGLTFYLLPYLSSQAGLAFTF